LAKEKAFKELLKPIQTPEIGYPAIHDAILNISESLFIVDVNGEPGVCRNGALTNHKSIPVNDKAVKIKTYVSPQYPENLGNPVFKKRYNIKYAYIAGDMAHGISSVDLVKSAGKAKALGFFGSAGLKMEELEKEILRLKSEMATMPFGVNLIHSPGSSSREFKLVDLFFKHDIHLISASGYLNLSAPLVYYRLKGIKRDAGGDITCANRIIAKASRMEVARLFLSPPPDKIVSQLLEQKMISKTEAELSRLIPMADDLTAEADSAGHTDNRPAISLLPSLLNLRDQLYQRFCYRNLPCLGLAGGIGTPMAVAAAFTLGADYVLTGSINQACIEAGTSDDVRQLLAAASQTDMTMAPAADMFERGIRVQVLKHGTMFHLRAAKLYELYRRFDSYFQIPETQQKEIEEKILQCSFEEAWEQTRKFFAAYDPERLKRAEKDPKHQMALVFRSYLGQSSRWAICGEQRRKKDYQIWCGPSMGAFNEWAKGTFLEDCVNRSFEVIAMNMLYGACVATRRQAIVNSGIFLPPEVGKFLPMRLSEIRTRLKMNK